jgi:hypothetical protein
METNTSHVLQVTSQTGTVLSSHIHSTFARDTVEGSVRVASPCINRLITTAVHMLDFTERQNVFIFLFQLYALRKLMQGPETIPKAPLGNNARPLQPLHHRTVRTNIDFKKGEVSVQRCKYSVDVGRQTPR